MVQEKMSSFALGPLLQPMLNVAVHLCRQPDNAFLIPFAAHPQSGQTRLLKGMEIGQVLEMIATDPGAVPDMEAWENQTRHELLLTEEQEEGKKFRFLIKKTH